MTRSPINVELENLLKTGSESIEATLLRRRILFAGFVARMEDTRLPKCVMFGEMVGGAGCVRGQGKEWMGCSLDDLSAFGINSDQWTTAAQDEEEWRRTAEQGVEHFMAKWIVAEKTKAGLRHAVVCPNVTGSTKKDSLKQAGSCWFARPCRLATSGANLYPPRVWFADAMAFFSLVLLSMLSLKPRPFVQSSFDMQAFR